MDEKSFVLQLKKLESEHQSKIDIYTKRIQELKTEEEKLKIAIEILKQLKLNIPPEYSHKLNQYPEEIKSLENEIQHEKIYLDYLQNKVLPIFT
ncbi:MAG: hypothetical protein QXL78_00375 [Methanocellales archaeon]